MDWGSKATELSAENSDAAEMAQHSEKNFCDIKICGFERQKYFDSKSKSQIAKKNGKKWNYNKHSTDYSLF